MISNAFPCERHPHGLCGSTAGDCTEFLQAFRQPLPFTGLSFLQKNQRVGNMDHR